VCMYVWDGMGGSGSLEVIGAKMEIGLTRRDDKLQ
jgi:hypothetical protein